MTLPVRRVTLAVPSVGCSNSACLALHRVRPDVVPMIHQHGCSMLGDDVALTREILGRLMANPNVERSVVIGLGCESNQPDALAACARVRGAAVATVGIQEAGGLTAVVAQSISALAGLEPRPPTPHTIRIGLMADTSAVGSERVQDGIAALLEETGFTVVVSPQPAAARPAPAEPGTGVRAVWRGGRPDAGAPLPGLDDDGAARPLVRAGRTDVERLTALAVAGAEVTVVLTADASPIGSPVAPTVKVSCSEGFELLDDVVDVAFEGGRRLAERTVEMVSAALAGARTAAERGSARDVAIWRLAPCF